MHEPLAHKTLSLREALSLPSPDVIHVIDSLLGWGGAENRLVDEILSMRQQRHLVVRLFEGDVLDAKLLSAGIPVLALGLTKERESLSIPYAIRRLRKLVKGLRPPVIHTSLALSNLVGQLVGATFLPRIPVVSTLTRTGDKSVVERYFNPSGARWKLQLVGMVSRNVARLDHVSYRAVANHVAESSSNSLRIDRDRISVIPRGLEASRSALQDGHRLALGVSDRPFFVNVGRLSVSKGQDYLVRAFRTILVDLPSAVLAIAGEGQDAEDRVIKLVADQGIGESVRLLGYEPDVPALLAAADIAVVSSLTEGLPGVMLEAMSVSTPIVAFDIPGTREASDDGRAAVLVPPRDEAALARSVVELYRDTERQAELTNIGLRRVQTRYDLASVAKELSDLLNSAHSALDTGR